MSDEDLIPADELQQAKHFFKKWASLSRVYHDALTSEGFSAGEATTLVATYLANFMVPDYSSHYRQRAEEQAELVKTALVSARKSLAEDEL